MRFFNWKKPKFRSIWIEVLSFCAVACALFFANNYFSRPAKKSAQELVLVDPRLTREPSSTPEISEESNSVGVIELGCLPNKQKAFSTKSNLTRLSTQLCRKNLTVKSGNGQNISNGFDITFFYDKKSNYLATNYFKLDPGSNKISLEVQLTNGTKITESIEINRSSENKKY